MHKSQSSNEPACVFVCELNASFYIVPFCFISFTGNQSTHSCTLNACTESLCRYHIHSTINWVNSKWLREKIEHQKLSQAHTHNVNHNKMKLIHYSMHIFHQRRWTRYHLHYRTVAGALFSYVSQEINGWASHHHSCHSRRIAVN